MTDPKPHEPAPRPDPQSPAAPNDPLVAARALVATLSPEERVVFRKFYEDYRAQAGTLLDAIINARRPDDRREAMVVAHGASAMALERNLHAVLESEGGAETKRQIACKKGCNFCCYQSVAVSIVEAIAIAFMVAEALPDVASRVLSQAPFFKELSCSEHAQKNVACVFLEDGACSIHEFRPLACRSYFSFNRADCEDAYVKGLVPGAATNIMTFQLPATLRLAIATATTAVSSERHVQSGHVELIAAVALVLSDSTAVDRWLTGEEVFTPFRN